MLRHLIFAGGAVAVLCAGAELNSPKVTFTRDVAPILHRRCAECHRAGEVAPMPLLTYKDARQWAKAIREKVIERAMPPWLADPKYGHFENDRRLAQKEIDTLVAWADSGAAQGDEKDLQALPQFEQGWVIGKPDAVISLPEEIEVPATGVIPYKYITVETSFTEDHWIQAAEVRPGNRAVVHHIIVNVLDPNGTTEPASQGARNRGENRGFKLCGFAPGEQPKVFPTGTAKMIKAGSKLIFQLHYTPNGKAATDRSYIGLIFAREPVKRRALTAMALNFTFAIPPGDPNYEVRSSWTAPEDVRIIDLMPHMHLRGKDFIYTVVYPDGRKETILSVPRYDFNWQLLYRPKEPVLLPKGSRVECVAHFDNSPNNKYNPDPAKEVRWGPQTWEEMMIGWFDYVVESQNLLTAVQ